AIRAKQSAFQLLPVAASAVADSRFKLMAKAIQVIGEKYKDKGVRYRPQLAALQDALKEFRDDRRSNVTIETIWKLCHHGLRSFLDFLSQIEIDYRSDYKIIDRLYNKPHNLLRLYITNLRKRYSQAHGHFPNLFLNDALIWPNELYPEA